MSSEKPRTVYRRDYRPPDYRIDAVDLDFDLHEDHARVRAALDVRRDEILGVVGGSGAGKSVLMRTIIGLLPRREGSIRVFGVDLTQASDAERHAIEQRWGVLFQQGALFSSLTVRDNLQFPM